MLFIDNEEQLIESASKIRLLLLDVDGILTDGKLYFSNSGEESKAFHSLDGHGIKMLKRAGVAVGIITGRKSTIVTNRASDLGIDILYQGREDKIDVLTEIIATTGITADAIAYAGDDLPDLPVLQAVGLSFSVPGAHPDLKGAVNAITTRPGGEGAVREITDFILSSQANH
ncbi:MAG: HAD hydrolase family protein [Gammaproteobacteria bacterium]|jgi:3-deoxy-D-manno-octulosonate 8-phosphate phosphatase (KDO 8-P phosphatase)|nr:HAD hydrolase family protein [Gammaproteobacteria bacterium]